MLVIIKDDYQAISLEAARLVANRMHKKPNLVLGLATGSTPLGLYGELIRMHRLEGLDFSKVTSFNLDEYVGLRPEHPQSYRFFMRQNLFDHVNLDPRFTHVPDGMATDIEDHCLWYEQRILAAGGLDLQILGIGANGHIAFNEPGSSLGSRTRVKTLTGTTREANARFFGADEDVPRYALTMGVGTIMEARELLLVASGEGKAHAIAASVEGPITAMVPASIVQMHARAFLVIDRAAAAGLKGAYASSFEEAVITRRKL